MNFLASIVFAVGILLPLAAHSQTVQLRSGEHPDFSRLVFADTLGRSWEIERLTDRRVSIRFKGEQPDLDIAGVFDLIPRDRLQSLTYEPGVLLLNLACECGVEVSQIPTGHIVIDVLDDRLEVEARAEISESPMLPIPLQEMSLSLSLASDEIAPSPIEDETTTSANTPSQVRIQPLRSASLIPSETSFSSPTSTMACSLEQRAAAILSADPSTILDQLFTATSKLLDGQDRFTDVGIETLSNLYLSAGWGAEAISVLRAGQRADQESEVIAAALDNTLPPENSAVDPGCGPAATTLALLLGTDRDLWARTDQAAFVRFLADLPPGRWRSLEDRVNAALTELSAADLLTGLHPENPTTERADATPDVAGTDRAAVAAVLRLLERHNRDNDPLDEANLVNALALLPSIPPGPDAQTMRKKLAVALLQAGHFEEAIDLVKADTDQIEALVEQALTTLEPGRAVEFAMRARPSLPPTSPLRAQAAELIRNYGLSELAGAFAPRLPRPIESISQEAGTTSNPWISRDFTELADVEGTSTRKTVAQLVLSRNSAELPSGDLAIAEQILAESQEMSAAISALIQDLPTQ